MTSNIPPWIRKTRRNKINTNGRTNNDNYKLYNSNQWRKQSKQTRINNPICAMCGKLHVNYKGLDLDHIIPIDQGGAIWHEKNHQPLCKKPCHPKKSGQDQRGYNKPYQLIIEEGEQRKIPI